ncbi:tannase [Xanthomonas oryzae pv. oryzicola]|nr:tannase [Xanthomonas oryzae pv. oryzicola]
MSAYTHRAPRYSYFFGSSNGGRDALMAVQRYPNAFDGVIADAPSADWTDNAFSWLWSEDAEFGNPAATIAAAKLPAIQAAALAQCDAKDSTVDGVVNDPRLCRFDPSVLLCSAAETDSCLTAEQIMALDSILSGPVNPRTGQRIYPGFEPFAVATPTFWDRWVTGNATVPGGGHALLANHFFANMVFNTDSASFDHTKVNFDGDVALTNRTSIAGQWLSHVINATSPDLSRLRQRRSRPGCAAYAPAMQLSAIGAVDWAWRLQPGAELRLSRFAPWCVPRQRGCWIAALNSSAGSSLGTTRMVRHVRTWRIDQEQAQGARRTGARIDEGPLPRPRVLPYRHPVAWPRR